VEGGDVRGVDDEARQDIRTHLLEDETEGDGAAKRSDLIKHAITEEVIFCTNFCQKMSWQSNVPISTPMLNLSCYNITNIQSSSHPRLYFIYHCHGISISSLYTKAAPKDGRRAWPRHMQILGRRIWIERLKPPHESHSSHCSCTVHGPHKPLFHALFTAPRHCLFTVHGPPKQNCYAYTRNVPKRLKVGETHKVGDQRCFIHLLLLPLLN
jgi:hypothetical protein